MRSTFPLFAAALATSAPVVATEVVPLPRFRSVELNGGGVVTIVPGPAQRVTIVEGSSQFTRMRVDSDGKLRIDACNQQCPHNYQLRIQIQAPRVPPVGIHGGGAITAAGGFAPQHEVAAGISGGGKIDLRAVVADTAAAGVNGGGLIMVRPRVSLAAAVNGGGEVLYSGNPAVTMAVKGGGAVRRGD
jgi:hypothetical protein